MENPSAVGLAGASVGRAPGGRACAQALPPPDADHVSLRTPALRYGGVVTFRCRMRPCVVVVPVGRRCAGRGPAVLSGPCPGGGTAWLCLWASPGSNMGVSDDANTRAAFEYRTPDGEMSDGRWAPGEQTRQRWKMLNERGWGAVELEELTAVPWRPHQPCVAVTTPRPQRQLPGPPPGRSSSRLIDCRLFWFEGGVLVGVGPGARGGVRVRHKGRRQPLGPIEKPHDSNALPTAAGGAGAVCADLGHFGPTRTGAGAGGRPPGGRAPARRHAGARHHAACREQLARLRPGAALQCPWAAGRRGAPRDPAPVSAPAPCLDRVLPVGPRLPGWTPSLQLDRLRRRLGRSKQGQTVQAGLGGPTRTRRGPADRTTSTHTPHAPHQPTTTPPNRKSPYLQR